jgi:hypothetical protein
MVWVCTDEASDRNVTDPASGLTHHYVTRTYAPDDEDGWPRWTISINHFDELEGRIVVEVFHRENQRAQGDHARFWPIQLLGPIMATCKWAQLFFKVNLMEPWLGTEHSDLDSLGPFALEQPAVVEPLRLGQALNEYILNRVRAVYDELSLGGYFPPEGGALRLPHEDLWAPSEYQGAAGPSPQRLNDLERDFRRRLVDSYPEGERSNIWAQITRAVLHVWQESML